MKLGEDTVPLDHLSIRAALGPVTPGEVQVSHHYIDMAASLHGSGYVALGCDRLEHCPLFLLVYPLVHSD